MRKLVATTVGVIAIVAVAAYIFRSPNDTATAVSERSQQQQTPKHDVPANVTDTRAPPLATTRQNSAPAAPPMVEQQEREACRAVWERKRARERAALDTEPKDPAWAYPMEQKLREHLTQKLQSGRLEVVGIDCKTTFCEIKALLRDPEGSMEFNNAISNVSGQPWNDFSGMGTSASEKAGKTFYFGQLTRPQFKESPQPAEEAQAQAACMARSMEKQERKRAARDAEPKDPAWAEPMEQLLREQLTTRLGKHPVDSIDIDCRTTFCQIKAKGRTDDAYQAFQKVGRPQPPSRGPI